MAEAAAKQSKQARVPEMLEPAAYADVLSPEAVVLSHIGRIRRPGRPDRRPPAGDAPDRAGAWASRTSSSSSRGRRGVAVATFGPVVLRTETAAIVAAALALREMGFLG